MLLLLTVFQLSTTLIVNAQRTGQPFKPNQLVELKRIGVMIGQGKPDSEVQDAWKTVVNNNKDIDINGAIENILSEAKLEAQRNVNNARERVKSTSLLKEQVSNELRSARLNLSQIIKTKEPIIMQRKLFSLSPELKGKVIITPTASISSQDEMSAYVNELEGKLNSIGDDAQLANVDLQNILQKQQQLLQMLSNISKLLSDTALAVIRKLG